MMVMLLILYTSPYHIYKTVLIAKTYKSESISQSIPERREPDRMSEHRERKPTSKGLLARVKCQQRNARTRERDSFSLSQPSWIGFFAKTLLCCWFHYFSVLSRFSKPFWKLPKENSLRPAPYNTSLHSKFRQMALKLTLKGLDYTQMGPLQLGSRDHNFPKNLLYYGL